MKTKGPTAAALSVIGYTIGGIAALFVIVCLFVGLFFARSDEAWNTAIVLWFMGSLIGLPLSLIVAAVRYFDVRSSLKKAAAKKEPIQPPETTRGK